MPTGYTADVGDGKVTDFATFAMQCARAFGALITMRDEPSNAQIPDEFAPHDFHAKRLAEAKAELARLQALTVDQQTAEADAAHRSAVASWDRYEADKAAKRSRYETMLASVEAWRPPTADHAGMKKFMREQLTESIRFDCGPSYGARPVPRSRLQWYDDALAKARRDVEYHEAEHAKEVERAKSRTAWVKALRASLVSASK